MDSCFLYNINRYTFLLHFIKEVRRFLLEDFKTLKDHQMESTMRIPQRGQNAMATLLYLFLIVKIEI